MTKLSREAQERLRGGADAGYGTVIVFDSRVTAVPASALPMITAPVLSAMLVPARIVPRTVAVVPMVAPVPTE